MKSNEIVMSVKPKYMDMIESGEKTWEFRRRIPQGLKSGDKVLLYSSAPIKKVVGEMTVGYVDVWYAPNKHRFFDIEKESGLTYEEYKKYFKGSLLQYLIRIRDYKKYNEPKDLKEVCPNIKRAPQSFCYVS